MGEVVLSKHEQMPIPWRSVALVLLVTSLIGPIARAQPEVRPDTVVTLDELEVTALPFVLEGVHAPLALTVHTRTGADLATDPAITLDALVRGLPGIWVSDRESYALGERILARGLGWRAAFGVRGTHVLLDGVPLTLPDGQTMLNVVDAAAVRRIEVIRGPASVFWGSGSGGVLALSTLPAETDRGPRWHARGLVGAYGLAKADLTVRSDLGQHRFSGWGSYLIKEGFRDHSAVRLARAGVSSRIHLGEGRTVSVVVLAALMPKAEAPGGLTKEAAAEDPRQAHEASITQGAGKDLTQAHLAFQYGQPVGSLPGGHFHAALYGGLRSLDNPIVSRYIHLDRRAAGLRLTLEASPPGSWSAGVGIEGEHQYDDRLETENEGGRPGAEKLTDQRETVLTGALFARFSIPLKGVNLSALAVTGAARLDALRYEAASRLGHTAANMARTVVAVNPALGLSYRWRAGPAVGLLYANAAGALDAATTTELGNRPDGMAGFNPDLKPERTWGLEAGTRGAAAAGVLAVGFDLALFTARVDRLLLPFEVNDVTYYRNAGRTRHNGVEAAVDASMPSGAGGRLDASVAYTWTRAHFAEGGSVSSVEVPGFPQHLVTWRVAWQHERGIPLLLAVEGEAASAYFADDANTAMTGAYAVVHARAALVALSLRQGFTASPFVALRNAFDESYNGSVTVNAFGGRYYEPAAGCHVVAGLSLEF